jgi:hypothetical protein
MTGLRRGALLAVLAWTILAAACGHRGPATTDPTSAREGGGTVDLAAARERAAALIEDERYEEAAELLAEIRPSRDTQVEELWSVALAEGRAKNELLAACVETDGVNVTDVYDHCWKIPHTSRYSSKGCCTVAAERFGEAKLEEASESLRSGDATEALSVAEMLVADTKLPSDVRSRAERMATQARRRLGQSARGEGDDAADQAYEEAKALVAENDHEGCIRTLVAAPRTEKVVRVLISCYFETGDLRSACIIARQHDELADAHAFAEMRCP